MRTINSGRQSVYWNLENALLVKGRSFKNYDFEAVKIFASDLSIYYNHYLVTNNSDYLNFFTDEENFIQLHSELIKQNSIFLGSINSNLSPIDMSGGIYIDSDIDNLQRSNADVKIFLDLDNISERRDILEKSIANKNENVYIVHSYEQIRAILTYNLDYNLLLL